MNDIFGMDLIIRKIYMVSAKQTKEKRAWEILEKLKSQVAEILWNDDRHGYNSDHMILPWIQEETEYAIKGLNLPPDREAYFLQKLKQVIGEYIEEE